VYIAISALADKTTGNYDTVFAQFKAWALHMGYSHISPKVVNKYLSKVCFWKPTDFQAKNFRAAVDLLADVNQVDRPVNRLTARLVKAKVKAYQTGDQAIPQDSKVLPWLTSPPSSSIGAMMAILFLSGFRPFDLHRLCLACWDQARELLWARQTKGGAAGRSIWVPLAMAKHLAYLASRGDKVWWQNDSKGRDSLVAHIRSALATDPSRLPSFSLRTARHWLATYLYRHGASSPYIMRQLNHKWWATSQVYIHLGDDLPAPWRGTPSIPQVAVAILSPMCSFPFF